VLHGLAIAALWKMSPFRPSEPPQDAVVITVDAGAPPASPDSPSGEKPAEPETASTPEPTPPERAREAPQQAAAEPQPRQAETQRPEPPVQQQPPPSPAPPPSLEAALASPQELPPPDARDFPTIRMPLPPWPSPRPSPTAETPPPPPPPPPPPRPPQPAAAPPPQNAPASVQAPPSNSADWLIGKSRARNAYLDQVARLTSKYRRYPASAFDNKQQGRVVTRVTIARDGKLIDVRIDTSSGWPAIDAAELETIRKSAPFPPVPVDMPGDPLILILPINYDVAFSGRR
jgi:protein TonB